MKTITTPVNRPHFHYTFQQPLRQIAFFDIETTGLSPKASSLYLIGAMFYDPGTEQWMLTQWFADDYRSESLILEAFLTFLQDYRVLYHFNGATFDIPYLTVKCKKHHITPDAHCQALFENIVHHNTTSADTCLSIDLLKEIRPLKKRLSLPKANQTALEQWLGIHREDPFNGGELIEVYAEYMQKKLLQPQHADALEKTLLLHNHDDISGMLDVCSILAYDDLFSQPDAFRIDTSLFDKEESCIIVRGTLLHPVPVALTLTHLWDTISFWSDNVSATLCLEQDQFRLTIPCFCGTLKYFLADYKNYYYLPQEDTAIHKSVAQFVDAAYRKKATAATCYIKKDGFFLPAFHPKDQPDDMKHFLFDHKQKPYFIEITPQDASQLQTQLLHFLQQQILYF